MATGVARRSGDGNSQTPSARNPIWVPSIDLPFIFFFFLSVCLSPPLSLSLSACLTKYSPGSNHAGPNNHQSLIGNICSAANTPGRGLTCFVNLQTRCWIDTHPRLKFRNTHKAGYSPSQRFYVYRTPGRKYTHQNMRLCIATVK